MTTKKPELKLVPPPAVTPENWWLDNVKAIRVDIQERIDCHQRVMSELRRTLTVEKAKSLGIPNKFLMKDLKESWSNSNEFKVTVGGLRLEIQLDDKIKHPDYLKSEKHYGNAVRAKNWLCTQKSATGARKFGAYVRTRHGRKPTIDQIMLCANSYIESNTDCVC